MSRPRVLCMFDFDLPAAAREPLEAVADVDYRRTDRDELVNIIGEYDAFWGHFDTKVDRPVLEAATKLRAINTATTGTDHIDKAFAAERGVRILCIAEDLALLDTFTATAELAWLLLLACRRRFRTADRHAKTGPWGTPIIGDQLSQHTLGVLGVGRLGKMTAAYGKGFRMRVLGCDRKGVDMPGVDAVDFDTLLAESDAISIHIHMTADNRHLFNAATFAKMKPGATLINTSRGDIIDETALLAALESGRLAAFGSDVLHDEWRDDMSTHPVVQYARDHDNVVLTPHIGGATNKSIDDARVFSARKLAHYLATGEELTMR